jgi:valyl-tRNA synthetase
MELPSQYSPQDIEKKWAKIWDEKNYFHADEHDGREPYCIVIPPPNVTGSLHMGHALNNTLQDVLARWQRMKGKSVLWMPGMDHAGIATQNVVEKLLAKEGKTKHDLGREKFEERVWAWKAESGGAIKGQLKRLGCSLDWQRERFTLDEGLSRAVRKVFVELYKEGLIYQGERIINWCPRCETALSDIETEYKDLNGKLYHIKYPISGTDEFITVATTRPETMLGDTGVAVNPDDERYKNLVGKMVMLPLMNREIPVFADAYVDASFGTGLVKVTPAHDPNDFDMATRHSLPFINVLDRKGHINENGGIYEGLDRTAARAKVLEDLDKLGLLEKIEDHAHAVGHCYRCQTVIEPYLSKQWFVKIKPLAETAVKAVEDGSANFVPKNWEKTYFEWMRNIRDWCISRQLWWGHRVPAFYCDECGHINVEMEDPTTCSKCGSAKIRQDDDVLDTWFSSGLWPFSTLGWPDKTTELDKYYPTAVLVTGFDIIFFWVARMMMMGLKFMGRVPFKDIYIHALVRDEHGHKMSKSRGNVIDPLVIMDSMGTDAFRFTLSIFAAQGRDVLMSEKRVEGYRAYVNKVWNGTRYILMNLGDSFEPKPIDVNTLTAFDKWILHRLGTTTESVNRALEEYRFNEAAQELYDFFWHEFCDWYIELTKPRLFGKETPESAETAKQVLFHTLKTSVALMHPFMPFITEEIWETITKGSEGHLIVAKWPEKNPSLVFDKENTETELFKEIIYKIRNLRGEMNIPPDRKGAAIFKTHSETIRRIVEREELHIKTLAKLETISIDAAYTPDKTDAAAVIADATMYLPMKGLIDFEAEKARLSKELAKAEADLGRVQAKLGNESFVAKAPADVIEKEKAKLEEFSSVCEKLREGIAKLG